MASQEMSEGHRAPPVDRSQSAARGGSIGMVLLVAIALVGAAVGLLLVGRGKADPYILALLAFLAMAGVFSLFALATGILRCRRAGPGTANRPCSSRCPGPRRRGPPPLVAAREGNPDSLPCR